EGILKAKEGIYTGFYPRELIIYNTATRFGGTLFGMAPLPGEEDEFRLVTRAIHSLFHRYQDSVGLSVSGYNTANMDEKNARLWIKLEWKALRKALDSEGPEQQVAIRDALIFRGSNHELYPNFTKDQIRFENYEGLSTFTHLMLATNSPEEYKTRLLENLDRIYSFLSYARSYGSIHGALYATLLYNKTFNFKTIRSADTDLGELVRELYDITLPSVCRDVAGSLVFNYDLEIIKEEEARREMQINQRIDRIVSTFTDKPVVYFELISPYFDFEPEDIRPLGSHGTLYEKMRISDNWGKLSVNKGGCLVSANLKYLRITSKGIEATRNRVDGEGWHLILNNDWEIVQVEQNYFVRKPVP
ncbi:MAG TPA: hypothetical protein DDW27_05840, partial [Bacteroidales bacterium]|nr:hypothetical protein [Bacteroidales bacterium]